MTDASGSGHPTGGRSKKHKNPAASSAAMPSLPRLPDIAWDAPSDVDGENEAKQPRSTSTTPTSGVRPAPDEYDWGNQLSGYFL